MTVKYSLTADDVVAMQPEAMALSPTFGAERAAYRRQMWGWCVALVLLGGALAWASFLLHGRVRGDVSGLFGALAVGVILSAVVTFFGRSHDRVLREALRRRAMSGALDLLLGAYEMTCDEKGLRVVGPWSDGWLDWKLVHGVTRTERFVIVMLRTGVYYAVPLGAVEGDFVEKVMTLNKPAC